MTEIAKSARQLLSLLLCLALFLPVLPAQTTDYVFHSRTEVVLVNVTVRDKDGNFVRTLKPEDFTVLEDNRPQKVISFDLENTDAIPTTDVAQVKLLTNTPNTTQPTNLPATTAVFKDRRLVVLFFDLSSMQPDEIERATVSAQKYVDTQMAPADVVAIISLGNSPNVDQDFTADRAQLKKVLQAYNTGGGQGFEGL